MEIGYPFESWIAYGFIGDSSDLGASYGYQAIRFVDIAKCGEYLHCFLQGITVFAFEYQLFRGCEMHDFYLQPGLHRSQHLRNS